VFNNRFVRKVIKFQIEEVTGSWENLLKRMEGQERRKRWREIHVLGKM
jgi:hypothetical protein